MIVHRPLPAAENLADLPTYAEITHAVFQWVAPENARAQHTDRTGSPCARPSPLAAARTALA
ncbi:hypothetical protein [Streptomyces beigongshangae]|uniref:hypothetical protein n=1 Tax=Streptomyces beigongshangae TaxID=2841597 RepID=UPI001C84C53E|nr:hypothetical protein [Streptomyces sp. REN17]